MSQVQVTVYCLDCEKVFWEGSLQEWEAQLNNSVPPKWFNEAVEHQRETKGRVMVKYPSMTVPFNFWSRSR